MTLRPLNTERNFLLSSPKPHSPRDACSPPVRSPTTRLALRRETMAGAGVLERSLSFKNWEATAAEEVAAAVAAGETAVAAPPPEEETASRCINGARPGILLLQSPKAAAAAAGKPTSPAQAALIEFFSPKPRAELDEAATKAQKLFKGHRTRRNLADCAIVVEELWWKAYVLEKHQDHRKELEQNTDQRNRDGGFAVVEGREEDCQGRQGPLQEREGPEAGPAALA